jgi:hypothetical protein
VLFRFSWGAGEGQLGVVREEEEVQEVAVAGDAPSPALSPGAPPPVSPVVPVPAPAPAPVPGPGRASLTLPGPASGPDKMVVDSRGNVFIDDPVNRRTLIWDRATRAPRVFASPFPFSRACCFDGSFVYVLMDSGDKVGRIEKTDLRTGASTALEFDQSAGVLTYDGLLVDKQGVITLESPRNGKIAVLDPWAKKAAVTEGGVERMVLPLEIEPLHREGEEKEAPPVPPWSVDDPPLALYTGGMTVVAGDQVKVDAGGRVYLRLVKARESVFHREFLQCYDAREPLPVDREKAPEEVGAEGGRRTDAELARWVIRHAA